MKLKLLKWQKLNLEVDFCILTLKIPSSFFRILSIFNTHEKRRESLKETDNSVYLKESNSWIYSIDFKTSLTHTHFSMWD